MGVIKELRKRIVKKIEIFQKNLKKVLDKIIKV